MTKTAIWYSANRCKGGCWIFKNKRAPNTRELLTLTLSGPLIYSMCVCVPNHVWLFAAPWTVARPAPLSMGFPRQESWSGLPFLSPGNLPNPGIRLASLASPALAGRFFISPATREAQFILSGPLIQFPSGEFSERVRRTQRSQNVWYFWSLKMKNPVAE